MFARGETPAFFSKEIGSKKAPASVRSPGRGTLSGHRPGSGPERAVGFNIRGFCGVGGPTKRGAIFLRSDNICRETQREEADPERCRNDFGRIDPHNASGRLACLPETTLRAPTVVEKRHEVPGRWGQPSFRRLSGRLDVAFGVRIWRQPSHSPWLYDGGVAHLI